MESQKELHKKLEAKLLKSEEDLKTAKIQLEEEKKKIQLAKQSINNKKSYRLYKSEIQRLNLEFTKK